MTTNSQDAFGELLLAHLSGERVYELVERDDGYLDVASDLTRYFAAIEGWPKRQTKALSYLQGPNVLDIGCGAGRVGLHLQQQGFQATSVDSSPGAVQVCRRRGLKDVRQVSITELSSRWGTFNSLILFGNNFGLMGGSRRARWLLRRFFHMTDVEGRVLAASLDPYQTENPVHLSYQQRNRARGRMAGQVRIRIRFRQHRTDWFDYLFVSPDEMRKLLQGSGWRMLDLIQEDSPQYVAVLEKEQGRRV